MSATIIVPTFNEAPNVAELVRRLNDCVEPDGSEILFVDDSTDDTPATILEAATWSAMPVRMIHRDEPVGGLSGAVVEGIGSAANDWCVVMDGDLQHPPELVPVLLETGAGTQADVVVASRHIGDGSNAGLSGLGRKLVSNGSIAVTRAMFPSRLRNCTDPMTGFFAVRRSSIDVARLRPQGFKILLEILARQRLRVVEEPFIFGERHAGASKANITQGLRFVQQLASLRFGRMSRFAVIGAVGAVLNLAIMAGLIAFGVEYLVAALVAAAITIVGNFFMQEYFVFRDLRHEGRAFWQRFVQSVAFNSAEALVRLPFLYLLVEYTHIASVIAQAVTILVAFVLRFFPLTGVGFSLLMPFLAEWRSGRLLATPVQFLARISYALYLVHWGFMFVAMTVPEPFRLLVYVGGSFSVAIILSYAIEYPIMRRRPKQI